MKKSLKRLAIDTATKYIYLALLIDDKEVASIYQVGDNDHSVTILPLLEKLLDDAKITLKDIDEIIIGIGPGSYTGVRIGVTVGKMIGYLNNISVFQVSSLALIASSSKKNKILSLIDARRNNAFMAYFNQQKNTLEYIKNDTLENIESFQQNINEKYEIVEYGKPNIKKIIKSNLLVKVEDIHKLTPNYLRITEAERNLEK
ncbi:MAG: tRNA (adenosine(37)-N6)-threonylcarbamoyltransferase complex dimerization subunit type 1 TsaB [Candidatus Izimaplasma sp.]|nr:tRNA (adenosine(37)-N6)-threonylcarbamoyltransferase complex dimerization subunit type 1 TsaB [Candidatus Izimaplasma bacterium]